MCNTLGVASFHFADIKRHRALPLTPVHLAAAFVLVQSRMGENREEDDLGAESETELSNASMAGEL
jgi:hypothetical protein